MRRVRTGSVRLGSAATRDRAAWLGRCGAVWLLLAGVLGCAGGPSDVEGYRLSQSGSGWTAKGADHVLDDLQPRYPEFFEVVLDPERSDDPPTEAVRDDLEKTPVDRANFDALNAVAIGYYEMNQRGERAREKGDIEFMSAGFRAAKIVAVPWRAYHEIEDPALRDAILDFFEDVSTGEKADSARTRGRLARIVESLREQETDPARRARIDRLTAELFAAIPPLPGTPR